MPVRTPSETLQTAITAGCTKAAATSRSSFSRLILGSILAGAYIALGGALSLAVGSGFPGIAAENPGLQKLLSGLVFPVGLMLVVVLGADLFTGNNALLMPPLFERKLSAGNVIANWTAVWCFNFVGALAVAYFLIYLPGTLSTGPYPEAIAKLAAAKTSMGFGAVLLKGIGANWCVCLAVWLRCLTKEEWIEKMWFIYTMEYYSVIKSEDILSFAGKQMELENILSEVTQ